MPKRRKRSEIMDDLRALQETMWCGRYDFEIGEQKYPTEQAGPVTVCLGNVVRLRLLLDELDKAGK